ncbi:MAG: enoyl-CoA hydratase-related protein [Microthrixaceae bacterium]
MTTGTHRRPEAGGAVRVDDVERVRVVTMCRPDRRNAVDGPMAAELHEAFVDFDADDHLDVAVLTGRVVVLCRGRPRGDRLGPGQPGR